MINLAINSSLVGPLSELTLPAYPSPAGAVLFVNSAKGLDAKSRLNFVGASTSQTAGSTRGPQAKGPEFPLASVFGTNGALSYCSANRGDLIVVLPGHTENVTAAATIPAGVTIIGTGYGTSRPTFTFTANVAITQNAGSRIQNLIFDLTGVAALTKGFVNNGAQVVDCRVIQTSVTNQAAIAFQVAGNGALFSNVEIDSTAAAGAVHGIVSSAAVANLAINSCRIYGNFSAACVGSATTNHITEMTIQYSFFVNRNAIKVIFNFTVSSTGLVANNIFNGFNWTTAADAISNSSSTNLRWFQNYGFDDGAGVVSGVLVPAAGTIA